MQRVFDEELLSIIHDDNAPNSEDHAIEITEENAHDCVRGYISGKMAAKRWHSPAENMEDQPKIYQIGYRVGYRDQLAKMNNQELEFSLTNQKVRDCVLGFDSGRKRALNNLPPREDFTDTSQSYLIGYDVGYMVKTEKMADASDGQKAQPPPKKLHLELIESVTMIAQWKGASDDVIEFTGDNVEECVSAYNAGRATARKRSKQRSERRRALQIEQRAELPRSCYAQGYSDQLASMQGQPLDTHPTAVNIRDCVIGFKVGERQAHFGPFPVSFKDKVTKKEKSPSYIAGYQIGFSFKLMKLLDELELEKETSPALPETEEVMAEEVPERVTDFPLPVPGLLPAESMFRTIRESQQHEPNYDFDGEIKITEENAEECALGYMAGEKSARVGTRPAIEMRSQIYQVGFNIGHQDRLAKMNEGEIDLTPKAVTVRDCALGFDAGRTRVRAKQLLPQKFIDRYTRVDKSPSYVIGYKVGYRLQWDKLPPDEQVIEEKKPRSRPIPKKPRIKVAASHVSALLRDFELVSLEITEENAQDCISGYTSGARAAKRQSYPAENRGIGHTQEKSEMYRVSYGVGYRDEIKQERDTDEMAINIRDCIFGFEAGRSRARKQSLLHEEFINLLIKEGKSPSYIIGYKAGYQFQYNKELKRKRGDAQEKIANESPKKKPRLEIEETKTISALTVAPPEREEIISEGIAVEGELQNFSLFRHLRESQVAPVSALLELGELPVPGRD